MEDTIHCKNCENEISRSYGYCPHCGQKANDELTIQVLFNNTISNYFSVDARFFRSFLPLILKPGALARRFVDGKRMTYLHPAQYYLFISVVFFFLFSLATREAQDSIESGFQDGFQDGFEEAMKPDSAQLAEKLSQTDMTAEEIQKVDSIVNIDYGSRYRDMEYDDDAETLIKTGASLDSLISAGASQEEKLKAMGLNPEDGNAKRLLFEQVLKLIENRGGGFKDVFIDIIPIAMFFILPIFALLLKLVYWKRGRFSHHMVFSFYYFTFIFLLFSLVMLFGFWIDFPGWFYALLIFATFLYLWVSSKNFYKQGWGKVFLKSSLVSFTYTMVVIPFSFVFMIIISFLLY